MVDSTRRQWEPRSVLINGVSEFLTLRKEGLIPGYESMTPWELQLRAKASAAYARRIIRLLMQGRLGELHHK